MRVLSLFDGIACGRVALERAGIPVTRYYASEIDKHAISVARNNWSDIIHIGDVRDVKRMCETGLLGDIDLLIGGSPCQGFSQAGVGGGFSDPRSQLLFEYFAIRALVQPRWFLLENVKMKREWLNMITIAMGVEPVLINSADFSAQNRQRYYWTNIPVRPWVPVNTVLRDVLETGPHLSKYKLNRTPSRERMWANGKGSGNKGTCINLTNRKKTNTITTKQDRQNCTGLIEYEDFCRYVTPVECERLQTLPDNYTAGASNTQRYKMLGNGWTVDVIAHIMRGIK